MSKSNQIALQLVNNYTEDINIALFPNVNNLQFVQSQTEETVQGQYYNFTNTSFGMDDGVILVYKTKKDNSINFVNIPYTGSPEGSGNFDPTEFVAFCINWLPENGYGYASGADFELTLYSDDYEFLNFNIPSA